MRGLLTISVLLAGLASVLGCGSEPEAGASRAPSAGETWLLVGGTVLTMDSEDTVFEPGAVAISGSRIEAVGSVEEIRAAFPDAPTRSAEGRIVLPGLINTHTHAPMTLFRGLADDLPLMEWLQEVIFPAEAENVDEEFVR